MMKRSKNWSATAAAEADFNSDLDLDMEMDLDQQSYFTYRPLSNLPTPPPTTKTSAADCSHIEHDDTETNTTASSTSDLNPKYRGPAIHLINLVPSSASLATCSLTTVQSILTRASLPIETVALAVCLLDSLPSRFARNWRLSCPLLHSTPDSASPNSTASKRHTLPPTPSAGVLTSQSAPYQTHIDSVKPELIILAALVIASKFTNDQSATTGYYCRHWGVETWSHEQLNVTERCILVSLNYRVMPLYEDGCLTDAMVDMQLAAREEELREERRRMQLAWKKRRAEKANRALTPPDSGATSEDDFVPSHTRSKTLGHPSIGFI